MHNRIHWLCMPLIFIFLAALLQTPAIYSKNDVRVLALDWSPDGTQIATGDSTGNVAIWDIASGALVQFLQGHTQEIMTLKWSPDRTRIASGSPDGTVRIWDAVSGAVVNTIQFTQPNGIFRAILDMDWSPDSTLIAGARETGQVIIWDAQTREQHASYSHDDTALTGTASRNMVLTVAWSPLGDVIASGGVLGDMLLWDVNNRSLSEFTPVISTSLGPVYSISWSPTGEKIAVSRKITNIQVDVEVYSFSTRELLIQIPQVSDSVVSLRWSPDDTLLVVSDPESVTIVNTLTGLTIDRISVNGILDAIAWSPYGGRLAVRNIMTQPLTPTSRLENVVQIIVPTPSLERLQAIAAACDAPASMVQMLPGSAQAEPLRRFITQVEALPENTIPPACAADLIAVAEALQRE